MENEPPIKKLCLTLKEAFACNIWKTNYSCSDLADFVIEEFFHRNQITRCKYRLGVFLVMDHNSIWGCVRPSVRQSVGPSDRNAFSGGQRLDGEPVHIHDKSCSPYCLCPLTKVLRTDPPTNQRTVGHSP